MRGLRLHFLDGLEPVSVDYDLTNLELVASVCDEHNSRVAQDWIGEKYWVSTVLLIMTSGEYPTFETGIFRKNGRSDIVGKCYTYENALMQHEEAVDSLGGRKWDLMQMK